MIRMPPLVAQAAGLCLLLISSMLAAAADETSEVELATAIFAGGCFWCMEPPYDELPGVASTISGYIGGHVDNPTYEQVSSGSTGHAEVVKVSYDPKVVDYATLLEVFFGNNVDDPGERREVVEVMPHPLYEEALIRYDLGLVRLDHVAETVEDRRQACRQRGAALRPQRPS